MCSLCRITELEGLLIVQPYHPRLFQQGGLPGPELIMQFWRGQLKAEDLPRKWEEYEAAASKQQKRLDKMLWKCYACERELKATGFGVQAENKGRFAEQVLKRVLSRGACRYCVDCMQQRRAASGAATKKAGAHPLPRPSVSRESKGKTRLPCSRDDENDRKGRLQTGRVQAMPGISECPCEACDTEGSGPVSLQPVWHAAASC